MRTTIFTALLSAADPAGPSALPTPVRDAVLRAEAAGGAAALDRLVVLVVTINPEGRARVERGPGAWPLARGRPGYGLVKVVNQSGSRPRLAARAAYAGGGPSPFRVGFHEPAGVPPELTGGPVEYRAAWVASSAAGRREVTLSVDAGQGSQDLGFRGEVPVLFDVRP